MTTIRRATGEHSALIRQLQEQSQGIVGTSSTAPTATSTHISTDGVDRGPRRVTSKLTDIVGSALPPPTPPSSPQLESVASAVQMFSGSLMDLGGKVGSGEEMLLAFLKLQLLESARDTKDAGLARAQRSQLLAGAFASAKNGDQGLAAQRREQAAQFQNTAEQERDQANRILTEAAVDPNEVEALIRASVAEGKGGHDVASRYAQAHADDPQLQEKLAALGRAEPHVRSAHAASTSANQLLGEAGRMEGAWLMGTFLSNSVRAGAEGTGALLANQEAQKKLANELMALLSGQRPDARAKEEAMREMEASRQLVVEMLLKVTEEAERVKSSALAAAIRG